MKYILLLWGLCYAWAGKAQDYKYLLDFRIHLKHTKPAFITFSLDSLKDHEYLLVFGQQVDYLARFNKIEPAERDEDLAMFDTPLRPWSPFHLSGSIIDSIIRVSLTTSRWSSEPLPKNQIDAPAMATCHYLVPKSALKRGKNIRIPSNEIMEIWCVVAKPSEIKSHVLTNISLDYKAGKRIEFFFDSSLKMHTKEADLPTQNIYLNLEIQ